MLVFCTIPLINATALCCFRLPQMQKLRLKEIGSKLAPIKTLGEIFELAMKRNCGRINYFYPIRYYFNKVNI